MHRTTYAGIGIVAGNPGELTRDGETGERV